jgi:NADH dehydrogenase
MSALNAAPDAPSHYLRSKGEAENLVHSSENVHVTSFRPSVIFGPSDSFFNRFAALLRITPGVFPLACADALFAPVYVGDLSEAMIRTLLDPYYYGKRLEICGPKTYTLKQLVEYAAKCAGLKRIIVPLPDFLSRIQATMFDLGGFAFNLIGVEKPFSMDNYQSLKLDSVSNHNDLGSLGIKPTSIEAVVPYYLSPAQSYTRNDKFRRNSSRSQAH